MAEALNLDRQRTEGSFVRRDESSDRGEPDGRLRRSELGASAVEFAIIVPVLLLFLYGIIEFGCIFMVQHGLTETAADAARTASTAAQSQAQTIAMNDVEDNVYGDAGLISYSDVCNDTSGALTCTTTVNPCPNQPTGYNCLTVTVTYNYSKDGHAILPNLLPSSFTPVVSASSTILLTGALSS